jgi:ribulose-phosphate 3-epimerase
MQAMVKISPSILSADQTNLKWAVDAAADGGADFIHVDVMDMHLVPNLTIGPTVCADIARNSRIPLDIHMMVEDPAMFTELLAGQLKKRVLGGKFEFENIVNFPDDTIKQIVSKVDIAELALAVKGAGEELFKKVLDNLNKENGARLVQEMGNLTTVKRDKINAARERISEIVGKGASINPVKYLVAHQEACIHLDRVLNHIRAHGFGPGVSLNPATPVSTIEHVLHLCDIVLIMSVNPGFGGQEFIPYTLDKVRQVRKLIDEKHLNTVIEIDGGITTENANYAVRAGCDILVAGAAVFNDKGTPADNIKAIRDACATVA